MRCVSASPLSLIHILWRTPEFGTGFEIVVDSFFKGHTKFFYRLTVETHYIANTCDMANEETIFIAVFDTSGITLSLIHIYCARRSSARC